MSWFGSDDGTDSDTGTETPEMPECPDNWDDTPAIEQGNYDSDGR